jgi:hypothetical protein
MLHTNLSTRPFYNIRAVQALLGAVTALVMLLTMFNVVRLLQLGTSQRSLGARAVEAQTEAARLRSDAARIRAQVDAKELEVVSNAAREANAIIDMRAFSWSELFAQFEATLPENARITAVQPRVENDGRLLVSIRVEARQVQDLERFLDALEMTGTFQNVLTTDEQTTTDGLLEAIVEARYVQPMGETAASKPGAVTPAPQGGAAGD